MAARHTGQALRNTAPNGMRFTVFTDLRVVASGAAPFYGPDEADGGDPHDLVAARRWVRSLMADGLVVPYTGRFASGRLSQPADGEQPFRGR